MALNPLSSFISMPRLRTSFVKARRVVLNQPPVIRVLLALIVVAGAGLIVYLSGQPFTPTSKPFVLSGRSFSKDDLLRIRRMLDGRGIVYVVDTHGRVQVGTDQFDTATGLLAKLDVGSRSVEELRNEATNPSFLDSLVSPAEKQSRELRTEERILESLIARIPEITWSFVRIHQARTSGGMRPVTKVKAFVSVETRDDSKLPFSTVEKIKQILVSNVNELDPNAVTVMDRKAELYLDDGDAKLQANSRDRAREERLRQEISEKLDWIKGVRVSVHLAATATTQADSHPPTNRTSAAAIPREGDDEPRRNPRASAVSRDSAKTRISVAANETIDPDSVEHDGDERTDPVEPRKIQPPAPPAAVPPPASSPSSQVRIGIEVPRSFYYHNYMIATSGAKEPSPEAIKPSVVQIETKIKESVKMMIPGPSEAWDIRVDMLPDDAPLERGPAVAHAPQSRSQALRWEIIGAVVTLAVVASASAMIRFGKRPAVRTSTASGSRRFHRDSPSDPAPTERVQELVRRNPQAAASVLQRWVGQGEEVA